MEWTESLRSAIDYMEENLLEDVHAEDVAESFTKAFSHFTC